MRQSVISGLYCLQQRPLLAMLLSAFCFALMNLCVKLLPALPNHEVVFFRSLGLALLCLPALQQMPATGRDKSIQKDLFLRAFFGTLGLIAYFYTLKAMPLASAVSLQYLNPIFASLVALFLLREPVRKRQWLFFGVSFSGVLLIRGFDGQISGFALGVGIFAAACSGFSYTYVRKLRGRAAPNQVILWFASLSLVLLAPYTLLNWVWPIGLDWLWVGLLGLSTYSAQVLMTWAYQGSKRLSLVANLNYTGLIYALLLGWLIFGEQLSLLAMLGMGLIIAGVVLGSRQAD